MFYVNVPKVRGRMAEKGFTVASLSNELHINRNTLSSYLANPEKIPYDILNGMADKLCDGADDAVSIFFTPNLRKTQE